jgi:cobalt-precorrin-6B (C15)-methyltransferase
MIYPPGTPTQPEIIAIVLSKLELRSEDVFVDAGCGSGSVSISAAGFVDQVYAIDSRDEAVRAAEDNVNKCRITNIKVLKGEASLVLPDLDFDCAFVGGSRNLESVLGILMKKQVRFVVSAVRLETAALASGILKRNKMFGELIQIMISRGHELAGGTMLCPENPVFLLVGGKLC